MKNMWKYVILSVMIVILCFSFVGCSGFSENFTSVEKYDWHLRTANKIDIKNGTANLIARDDTYITEDTDAPVVDVILLAKHGKLSITDNGSKKNYSGTYKKIKTSKDSTIFEITVEGISGNGTVSVTKYSDETENPTFPITIANGDIQYALQFQAKNK